jgi:hypothetical protein
VGIAAADPEERIRCRYHQWRKFHSASVIKVITLCALLYQLHGHENLSPYQADLAQAMITESDNDAQDTLWNEIGMTALQRFLTAAGMNHTVLGTDDYWGLTEVNAHDELRLLQLLITRNTVLDAASRRYALALMADVVPDQRWGVSAGAPPDVTVHLKNGWLPDPDLWEVNSIGDFTRHDLDYSIVILTSNDPDMAYGVATVERLARLINRTLARGAADSEVVCSDPPPSSGGPPAPFDGSVTARTLRDLGRLPRGCKYQPRTIRSHLQGTDNKISKPGSVKDSRRDTLSKLASVSLAGAPPRDVAGFEPPRA